MQNNIKKFYNYIKCAQEIKISSYSGDLVGLFRLLDNCNNLKKVDFYYNCSRFKSVKRFKKTPYTLKLHPRYKPNANYHQKIWIIDNQTIIISTGNINRSENNDRYNHYIVLVDNESIASKIDLRKCNAIIVDLDYNSVKVSHNSLRDVISKLLNNEKNLNCKLLSLGHSTPRSRLKDTDIIFSTCKYYTGIQRYYKNKGEQNKKTNFYNDRNHSKAFLMYNKHFALYYLGSSNFTAGGWENNIEGGIIYHTKKAKDIAGLKRLFGTAKNSIDWKNCKVGKVKDSNPDDPDNKENWELVSKCINYALNFLCLEKTIKRPANCAFYLSINGKNIAFDELKKRKTDYSNEEFLLLTVKQNKKPLIEMYEIQNPLYSYETSTMSRLYIDDIEEDNAGTNGKKKKKKKTNGTHPNITDNSIDVRFNFRKIKNVKNQLDELSETNTDNVSSKEHKLKRHNILIENRVIQILKNKK